jgi:nitrogenase molybdenum-iron protein alpha/beta subunit
MEPVFENTLRYTAPSHGDWGIVRIASLVPESFTIFICPFACGRHGALGAIGQGFKHRLAYIYITQKDIIEGYDQTLIQGVDEILGRLAQTPKAVMVYVSCLDDLIGTDLDALMDELHEKHPQTAFRAGHMNPITMESAAPPPVTTQDAMFSFLEISDKKTGNINLIGNLENIEPKNELFRAVREAGRSGLCHMSDFESFEGFQKMAQSSHNLVMTPSGLLAAQNMQKKHGIPFLFLPASYNIGEIAEQYKQFFEFVGAQVPVNFLPEEEAGAIKEIRAALRAVGERPIVISASATVRPFSMAEALIIYGFDVAAVVAQEVLPIDRPAFERLFAVKPDIQVIQPEHPEVIRFENRMEEAIAIGFDAAYITGSEHIVNLSADMRMFGYRGVRQLMRMIKEACGQVSDLKKLIEEYGVVI